jgi:hypothetical protein
MVKKIILRVRMDEAEFEKIQANADTAGLKISSYIRACATHREVKSSVSIRLLAELRRIGGMTKKLWSEGRREEAETIRAGLTAIRKAVENAEASNGR